MNAKSKYFKEDINETDMIKWLEFCISKKYNIPREYDEVSSILCTRDKHKLAIQIIEKNWENLSP